MKTMRKALSIHHTKENKKRERERKVKKKGEGGEEGNNWNVYQYFRIHMQ
jgi:hypothetical protein